MHNGVTDDETVRTTRRIRIVNPHSVSNQGIGGAVGMSEA